mmetsp:Transcript_84212/g.233400  ORF Transcript_84212/g.233400 Transcript_84212/m.233400 type:complete len:279 (+) Transcript_84212:588-1424(+)
MQRAQSAAASLQPAKCLSATATEASTEAMLSRCCSAPPAPALRSLSPRWTSSLTSCCKDLLTRDSWASTSLWSSLDNRSESSPKRISMASVLAAASPAQRVHSAAAARQPASCSSTAAHGVASASADEPRVEPVASRPFRTSWWTRSCTDLCKRASWTSVPSRSSSAKRRESSSKRDSTASALAAASPARRTASSQAAAAAATLASSCREAAAVGRATGVASRPRWTSSLINCCMALRNRFSCTSESRRSSPVRSRMRDSTALAKASEAQRTESTAWA